ncbi:hypothetical protein H5410_032457 [Solanum commersonii]|uniref:Terpene synthase N-terminal domain-containing protein n=1 Tax=Solanum commersonii TaxID=4109 RepID=A0A9J5YMX9_SOLCO|nr:hypothetical protein H5410_032457 [Solanum commersonii]
MAASSPIKCHLLANYHPTVWGYHFLSYTPVIFFGCRKLLTKKKLKLMSTNKQSGKCWCKFQRNDDNLHVVSLCFRLVRQQDHYMSANVFKKFTEQDGKFKETFTNDVKGLLSLYEALHLRVRDEEILEEALTFSTTHLKSIVSNLSNNSLKVEVTEALSQPIRMTLARMGAKKYISIDEINDAHNYLLLKFAKLDFNMLQKFHQRELNQLTRLNII